MAPTPNSSDDEEHQEEGQLEAGGGGGPRAADVAPGALGQQAGLADFARPA